MKRTRPAPRTLPFAVTLDQLIEYRQGHAWAPCWVRSIFDRHLVVEDALTHQRHTIPKTTRRLRCPHGAHLVDLQQLLAEHEIHRGKNLPALSGPVLPALPMYAVGSRSRPVPKRRRRYRCSAFLAFVRRHACIGCPKAAPSDPHHDGERGVGQKCDDWRCVPLCRDCHDLVQKDYCLPGLDRTTTESLIYQTQAALLAEWCGLNEEPEADAAERRYLEALSAPRGLLAAVGILLVLLFSAPALAGPLALPDPLADGQAALAAGHFTYAFRSCLRAAEDLTQRPARRAAALTCQGRAALGLKWSSAAIHLARQALRLLDENNARLLLADGLRAAGDCPGARPEYLKILEREPGHREARAGITACGGVPPAAPDGGHVHLYAAPVVTDSVAQAGGQP